MIRSEKKLEFEIILIMKISHHAIFILKNRKYRNIASIQDIEKNLDKLKNYFLHRFTHAVSSRLSHMWEICTSGVCIWWFPIGVAAVFPLSSSSKKLDLFSSRSFWPKISNSSNFEEILLYDSQQIAQPASAVFCSECPSLSPSSDSSCSEIVMVGSEWRRSMVAPGDWSTKSMGEAGLKKLCYRSPKNTIKKKLGL